MATGDPDSGGMLRCAIEDTDGGVITFLWFDMDSRSDATLLPSIPVDVGGRCRMSCDFRTEMSHHSF
jgi:hypothetical protein